MVQAWLRAGQKGFAFERSALVNNQQPPSPFTKLSSSFSEEEESFSG
jgi:hypothetical protein